MPDASEESAAEEAANALFEGQESIIYLDAAGEMKSATCTDISSLTEMDSLTGWYYIPGLRVVTIERRIAVSGDEHLILCDGAWLTIQGGINVSGNNSLTIYAQSTGDVMGKLTVSNVDVNNAGIGGGGQGEGGNITITGGVVMANGGRKGAGIGGGNEGAGGQVVFKKPGKVTITATAVRGKKKAKVKFKVSK